MKRQEMIHVLFLVLAGVMLSCAAQNQPEPSRQADSVRVSIVGSNLVTYASGASLELKAMFAKTSSFLLTIRGSSGGEGWSATAMLTPAQALAGRANLRVTSAPIGQGLANVTRALADGAREQASAGALEFAVTGGRLAGAVSAVPDSLGASVSGDSSVSCWVPRSSFAPEKAGGAPQGTTGTGGDDEALVEDVALSSPQCSALRAWHHG